MTYELHDFFEIFWYNEGIFVLLFMKKGFTLVELISVIAIVMLLTAVTLQGLVNSQKSFLFQSSYETVQRMMRQARSLAVTSKALKDYTDYDQDALNDTDGDYVTPAHYGLVFTKVADSSDDLAEIILFADLHRGALDALQNEGVFNAPTGDALNTYEAGKDFLLEKLVLPKNMNLLLPVLWPGAMTQTVFYTPVYADTSFAPPLAGKFFVFGVKERPGTSTVERKKCSKIQIQAGVAEAVDESECH